MPTVAFPKPEISDVLLEQETESSWRWAKKRRRSTMGWSNQGPVASCQTTKTFGRLHCTRLHTCGKCSDNADRVGIFLIGHKPGIHTFAIAESAFSFAASIKKQVPFLLICRASLLFSCDPRYPDWWTIGDTNEVHDHELALLATLEKGHPGRHGRIFLDFDPQRPFKTRNS